MRTAAFAIALMLSGTAIAQTTTTTTTQPDVDVNADVGVQPDGDIDVDADVDAGTTTTATTTGTMSTTSSSMQSHTGYSMTTAMAPASGQVIQPGNTNPEEDARGISVISAAAMVPAGWNGTTGAAVGGPAEGGDTNYPACSRTVTDNCVQTYERSRAR